MTKGLSKKILCFIDESGTARSGPIQLGALFVLVGEAGRFGKALSDLLPTDANEVHAVKLANGYLQGLMDRLRADADLDRVVMINQHFKGRQGAPSVVYAQAVVETVKIGINRIPTVLGRNSIGNVDVITDVNQHNDPQGDGCYRETQSIV